jgi:sporulation protein YlmC with PRC-barrel domain
MMNSVSHLNGTALAATDGEIGHVTDVFFDDEAWALRYFVVDTGNFLASREVLISPLAVKHQPLEDGKSIDVDLSRDQVEHSPLIDTHQPVSRRHELEQLRYYGYPTYWNVDTTWGLNAVPLVAPLIEEPPIVPVEERGGDDQHLRSCSNVKGYDIHASDGTIGHVADFVFDNDSWKIRYLVVDTRNWWPGGKKVLVGTDSIERIDWSESAVYVNRTREQVRASPGN